MVAKTQIYTHGWNIKKISERYTHKALSFIFAYSFFIVTHICAHLATFLILKVKLIFTLHYRDFYFHVLTTTFILWCGIWFYGCIILYLWVASEWSYDQILDFDGLRDNSGRNLLYPAFRRWTMGTRLLGFLNPLHYFAFLQISSEHNGQLPTKDVAFWGRCYLWYHWSSYTPRLCGGGPMCPEACVSHLELPPWKHREEA